MEKVLRIQRLGQRSAVSDKPLNPGDRVRSMLYWQADGTLGRMDVLAHEALPDGLAVAAAWMHTVSRSPKVLPDAELKQAKKATSNYLEQVFWALCEGLSSQQVDQPSEPLFLDQDVKAQEILGAIAPPDQPYVLMALALLLERRKRLRRLSVLGFSPPNRPIGSLQSKRRPKDYLSVARVGRQDVVAGAVASRHILYLHPPTGLQVAIPVHPWPYKLLPTLQQYLARFLDEPNNLT